MSVLDAVEVTTGAKPTGSVIFLHGLGADGHDFEPVVPQLVARGERALRFIFPHAPQRPVTLNSGYVMRAWYDIVGIDRKSPQDEAGIGASDAAIRALIERENERGIATERIVLAGFSQGGAMSIYSGTRLPARLAGIMALSCYMLLEEKLSAERTTANQSTPIFMGHGTFDPMVSIDLGRQSEQLLKAYGYSVEWHSYAMPHSVSPEEIADIAAWLRKTLP